MKRLKVIYKTNINTLGNDYDELIKEFIYYNLNNIIDNIFIKNVEIISFDFDFKNGSYIFYFLIKNIKNKEEILKLIKNKFEFDHIIFDNIGIEELKLNDNIDIDKIINGFVLLYKQPTIFFDSNNNIDLFPNIQHILSVYIKLINLGIFKIKKENINKNINNFKSFLEKNLYINKFDISTKYLTIMGTNYKGLVGNVFFNFRSDKLDKKELKKLVKTLN